MRDVELKVKKQKRTTLIHVNGGKKKTPEFYYRLQHSSHDFFFFTGSLKSK